MKISQFDYDYDRKTWVVKLTRIGFFPDFQQFCKRLQNKNLHLISLHTLLQYSLFKTLHILISLKEIAKN